MNRMAYTTKMTIV